MPKPTKRLRKATSKSTAMTKPKRFKPVKDRKLPERLPRVMIKARQHLILEMYASGRTPDQIAIKMKMPRQAVSRDLNIAIQEMIEAFAKPTPQQTFVRYAAFQLGVVRKLNDAIKHFRTDPETKQYNAWVSALRAQSDIYDKVFVKGNEYGVIKKEKADVKALQGGSDIRRELRAEITVLSTLLDHIDDQTQRDGLRGRAIQAKISYAVRVRVPIRTEFGIARAIPDWKYRQKVYDTQGNVIREPNLLPEQRLLLAPNDPDAALHQELAKYDKPSASSKSNQEQLEELVIMDSKHETGRKYQQPIKGENGWIVKPQSEDPL